MPGTVPKRDGRAAGFPSGAGRSRAGALSWSPDPARPPRLCVPTACSSARRAHSAAALRRAVMSHPGAQGCGTRTLHVPRFRETAQNTGRRPSVFLTQKTTTQRGFKHCGVKKGTEVPLASSPRVSEMADGASASLGRANPQQPAFRSRKGGTTASPRAHVGPAVTTALTSGRLRSAVR